MPSHYVFSILGVAYCEILMWHLVSTIVAIMWCYVSHCGTQVVLSYIAISWWELDFEVCIFPSTPMVASVYSWLPCLSAYYWQYSLKILFSNSSFNCHYLVHCYMWGCHSYIMFVATTHITMCRCHSYITCCGATCRWQVQYSLHVASCISFCWQTLSSFNSVVVCHLLHTIAASTRLHTSVLTYVQNEWVIFLPELKTSLSTLPYGLVQFWHFVSQIFNVDLISNKMCA